MATYSFKDVDVYLTIDTGVSIGFISVGVPIGISEMGFFGSDGAITVTPNPNILSSDDVSIDGELLPDLSNDNSGTMSLSVGDLTKAHYLLMMLYNLQKTGLLVKAIGITVQQKAVSDRMDAALNNVVLYKGTGGYITGLPNKTWGTKQGGNTFNFKFETITGSATIEIAGILSSFFS